MDYHTTIENGHIAATARRLREAEAKRKEQNLLHGQQRHESVMKREKQDRALRWIGCGLAVLMILTVDAVLADLAFRAKPSQYGVLLPAIGAWLLTGASCVGLLLRIPGSLARRSTN
jgi:hypothetical protein